MEKQKERLQPKSAEAKVFGIFKSKIAARLNLSIHLSVAPKKLQKEKHESFLTPSSDKKRQKDMVYATLTKN